MNVEHKRLTEDGKTIHRWTVECDSMVTFIAVVGKELDAEMRAAGRDVAVADHMVRCRAHDRMN